MKRAWRRLKEVLLEIQIERLHKKMIKKRQALMALRQSRGEIYQEFTKADIARLSKDMENEANLVALGIRQIDRQSMN